MGLQTARPSAVSMKQTPDADLEKPIAIRAEFWGKPGGVSVSMMSIPKESKIIPNKLFVAAAQLRWPVLCYTNHSRLFYSYQFHIRETF